MRVERIITKHARIHIPASDTGDSSLTYPFLDYVDNRDEMLEDPLGNDFDWFYPLTGICELHDTWPEFNAGLVDYLTKSSNRTREDVLKELTNRLSLVLSKQDYFETSTLNINTILTAAEAYGIHKVYCHALKINFVLSVPQRDYLAEIKITGSHIRKLRHVRGIHQNPTTIEYCIIELMEDLVSPNTDKPDPDRLEIEDCKIEYLSTTASNISLKRITELNLINVNNPGNVYFDLQDVHIRFRRSILQKYSDWSNPLFNTFSPNVQNKPKNKAVQSIRSWYSFYFCSPKYFDNVSQYVELERVQSLVELAAVSKQNAKRKTFMKGRARFQRAFTKVNNELLLSNHRVVRRFVNTFRVISSNDGIHSEEGDVMRYYHYFKSRWTFLGRILFWINEGYYNLWRPLLLFILSTTCAIVLTDSLTHQSRPVEYILRPVQLFSDLIFAQLNEDILQNVLSITQRTGLLFSLIISLYSLWSILVAMNRRFGFPKSLSDEPR